ncbi:MAG: ABC transporter permease [Methylococcales bacterium]|nr:ABC transporter permease [Methylococcales bacterium]
MPGFLKLCKMHLKLFIRQPVSLFFTIAFPLMLLLIFGMIFGNEPDPLYGGNFGYIDSYVPALAAIVVGTLALQGIPITTATYREQKILRRFKATPMKPFVYIASDVLVNLLVGVVGMGIVILVAKIVFKLRFGGSWPNVIAGFLLGALAFLAIGYIIASVAKTSKMAQAIGSVIFFPMMFVSGAAFPLAIMPEGLQKASKFLPMTQMVSLLQSLWFGDGWNTASVSILLGLLVIGVVVSVFVFRWE